MSVTAQITKHVFLGDGVNTDFPFTFDATADVEVEFWTKDDATPPVFTKLSSNFTVDLVGKKVTYPNTGTILPTGWKAIVRRVIPKTQGLDLINQGDYEAEDQETAYDRLTKINQDQAEELQRCVKFPLDEFPTDDAVSTFITRVESAQAAAEAAQAAAESAQAAAEAAAIRLSLRGTFDQLRAIAALDPTNAHRGYATDLESIVHYTGDDTDGPNSDGWITGL